MSKSINSFFTLLTLIIFSACSSVQVTEEAIADQSVAGVSITSKSTATQAVLANAVVYFEYDQFNLTTKSIQALKGVSELMNRNSKITISIEGHADERGTREYNLALGQRRAESVANYLISNGINRIDCLPKVMEKKGLYLLARMMLHGQKIEELKLSSFLFK